MPSVSVIIAAYNAEKYLSRCLASLLAQSFTDFEVIIVDDGSNDSTFEIANEYALKDRRFNALHQSPNKGQSAARELAMNHAKGTYTIHVDADDWVEPTMLEELMEYASRGNYDMVICDWIMIKRNGEFYEVQKPQALNAHAVFCQMLRPELHASLCNKLIKRSCYLNVDFHFVDGMLMEDQYALLRILTKDIRIGYLNKAFYHYDRTQNAQSTVNKGLRPAIRMKPLSLITNYKNPSLYQKDFDKAVAFIAYESLQFTNKECPDYSSIFSTYKKNIKKAEEFPFLAKVLILLRIYHIDIPVNRIKRVINAYKRK